MATSTAGRTRGNLRPYFRQINETPLLSAEEERELSGRVARGDPCARDRMVRANLRLVVAVARGCLDRGLPMDDLVAEGNLGLMRAVEGFNGEFGVRFSTYATHWIKQSIRTALMRYGKTIRLPSHVAKLLAKWKRASASLSKRFNREPTPDEVRLALRLSRRQAATVRSALETKATSRRRAGEDDEGRDRCETIPDARVVDPASLLADSETRERIAEHVGRLDSRKAAIVRLRYGLGGQSPKTLSEVGCLLDLTPKCVSRLQSAAIRELSVACAG